MSYLLVSPHVNLYSFTGEYSHNDTEELHEMNKKRFGKSWYWYDNPVGYSYNEFGYRMKELTDVDYDNYFAFFGCSFTVGTGLPLEETFAYKIAKEFDVDYVNGAVGGGSPDFAIYNAITLLSNAPKKPKAIVINWPELSRTCYWKDNVLEFLLPNFTKNISDYWIKSYQTFMNEESHINHRFKMLRNTLKLICSGHNIQLFEMYSYQSDDRFMYNYPDIHTVTIARPENEPIDRMHLNKARDVHKSMSSHPGIWHQDLVCQKAKEVIKL